MQAAGEWTHQDRASRMRGSGVVHGMGTGMEDPRMGDLQDGMLVHVCSVVCHSGTAAYSMEHVVECSACRGWHRMMHPDHEMKKTLGVGIPGSMDPGIIHLGVDACTVEWSVAIAGEMQYVHACCAEHTAEHSIRGTQEEQQHHTSLCEWMVDARCYA